MRSWIPVFPCDDYFVLKIHRFDMYKPSAGILRNNLQIYGAFTACLDPHAWEG